jgi:hypothetical protein
MGNFKEMPYQEKYEIVMDNIDFAEELMPAFVKDHLGAQAEIELRALYQEGIKPVPDESSFEEKYETAYGNWAWIAKSDFNFLRKHMGDEGIELFVRADVEALKRKNANPSLFFLSLIRAISPRTAFKMTAREFSYQLQWITPFSVEEMTPNRAVFDIPRCKIIEHPESDDLCNIGCQGIYPRWVAEQFKVKMEFDPKGISCSCTLTPLR